MDPPAEVDRVIGPLGVRGGQPQPRSWDRGTARGAHGTWDRGVVCWAALVGDGPGSGGPELGGENLQSWMGWRGGMQNVPAVDIAEIATTAVAESIIHH